MKTQEELKEFASSIYLKEVKVESWRENFINELEKRILVDKRGEGYHCHNCSKISKNAQAFMQTDRVIFPKGNKDELWLVNSHYDVCAGWD